MSRFALLLVALVGFCTAGPWTHSAYGAESGSQIPTDASAEVDTCPAQCAAQGDSFLVFCDTRLTADWAESVFLQELRAKLNRRQGRCSISDAPLYVEMPDRRAGRTDQDLRGEEALVEIPTWTPRTFSNVTFQFLSLEPEVVRPRGVGTDAAGADQQAQNVTANDESPIGFCEIANPTTPRTLDGVFGELEGLEAIPRVTSDLIRFVFVPRITPLDETLSDGDANYSFVIAPTSAVPARLFKERLNLGELGVPIGLEALQRELEPLGVKFIEIMQRHFMSTEGSRRLDDRRTLKVAAALERNAATLQGLIYTKREVEYFDLQLKEELVNQLYPNREEQAERRGELGYIDKFQRFWNAVDRAKALLEARTTQ